MPTVVIKNPILNSPYEEPTRHFYFDEDRITDRVVDSRRISSYFVPIAKPKKKGKQIELETEWTADRIEENKFHVAGPSNGGIAAFHVAALHPEYFLSVTAFPGYMWEPTAAKLLAVSKMCVFMYVGEFDPYRWHSEMKREADAVRAMGGLARFTIEQGQPHRLDTLAGANAGRLFDGFEETAKGCSK